MSILILSIELYFLWNTNIFLNLCSINICLFNSIFDSAKLFFIKNSNANSSYTLHAQRFLYLYLRILYYVIIFKHFSCTHKNICLTELRLCFVENLLISVYSRLLYLSCQQPLILILHKSHSYIGTRITWRRQSGILQHKIFVSFSTN